MMATIFLDLHIASKRQATGDDIRGCLCSPSGQTQKAMA